MPDHQLYNNENHGRSRAGSEAVRIIIKCNFYNNCLSTVIGIYLYKILIHVSIESQLFPNVT